MSSRVLKSWWWRPDGDEFTNFGDELGPEILKKLGYNVKRVSLGEAEILTTGTILNYASTLIRPGTIVWGSGVGHSEKINKRFEVHAVRGVLTAEALKVNVPLGDPGILTSLLWPASSKQYKIGVVKHYIDEREYDWADIVINPLLPVKDVIELISACEIICSSSLHGLIVADSYGIPAMRLPHDNVISGDFKWVDYLSSRTISLKEQQEKLLEAL